MTRSPEPMPADATEMSTPLLRAPPFPGVDASVTRPGAGAAAELTPDAIDRVFAAIRDARVGGCFWAPPSGGTGAAVILRGRSSDEIEQALSMLTEAERAATLCIPPAESTGRAATMPLVRQGAVVSGQVDPWSLLDDVVTLIAHGDDEWVALAVIAGARVRFLSAGRFGAPGDDVARLRKIVAEDVMRVSYRDPFTGQDAHLEATVALLADWRRTFEANRQIVAACGFSWWKRREIARFLWSPEHPLRFFRSERRALAYAARHDGAVAIWPTRVHSGMAALATAKNVPLVRVEDGFVRSVGLGSNLVPPSSVAVDRCGIHYDPGQPSDLETLLAGADFPPALLARAGRLRETILEAGISKYGSDAVHGFPPRQAGRRLVLVPGQVEDDMSVRLGGGGLSSNLELLRRARVLEPDAEIWFRPHPDVNAGHRKGAVRDADALEHADRIVHERRDGAPAGPGRRGPRAHLAHRLRGAAAGARGGVPRHALLRRLGPDPRFRSGARSARTTVDARGTDRRGADRLSALSRPRDEPALRARDTDPTHRARAPRTTGWAGSRAFARCRAGC